MILAATDGTDRSRAVLGRSALIARHWGARLALVHIRKPRGRRFRLGLARTATRDLMADLTEHGGHPEDLYVLDGVPAEGIAALSTQLQVDLMVLGLHRERRVLDTLRMTTMERITLAVDCPVLVAQAVPEQPYTRVLAALSFDPVCTGGVALATRIAPQAQFHAIHAHSRALARYPSAARQHPPQRRGFARPFHVRPRLAPKHATAGNRAWRRA